jgi:transposase
MSVLSKDTIEKEIIPHLSLGKRGKQLETAQVLCIVQLILYRLKTGCQWRELPIKAYFTEPYSWKSVFYHFNKWSKDGSWRSVWLQQLHSNKHLLSLRSAQLDGTHTPCKRGGESVGYQGRKGCKTTNMLCISDERGIIIAASEPEAGNHHDVFDIETHFEELLETLEILDIQTDGLILNADAGFDSQKLRSLCAAKGIEPNFAFNPRNGKLTEREEYFDGLFYKSRTVIEHAFAWLDAFKALIIRYEVTARNWFSWNAIGFAAIAIRKSQK